MAYYFYEDRQHERVRIHDAGCGYCVRGVELQARQAMVAESRWHGPFPTYDGARLEASGVGLPLDRPKCCA